MSIYHMRKSKQANNSYPKDEQVDAFSTAESSEGWCSICWFHHVTCENKRDTKKTNNIVTVSGLTVTAHTNVVIALVVMWCDVLYNYQVLSFYNIFAIFPESVFPVLGFPFSQSSNGWLNGRKLVQIIP